MTFAAEGPVASGRSYAVTEVNGRRPDGLADFVGAVEVIVTKDSSTISLIGEGAEIDGAVRLCQKERGPIDRDIRVWTVTDAGNAQFAAEPLAAF